MNLLLSRKEFITEIAMKVVEVLSLPDQTITQFQEVERPLIDMVFSLSPWTSVGKANDRVTSKIVFRHKLSHTPTFQWPFNTVDLYVVEYLDAPFMILATKRDREYGWSALHTRIHVLNWDVLHKLHSHFTLDDPKFDDFIPVSDDGEIEVGIGACRVALTSMGHRLVPSDWVKKVSGVATDSLVYDENLLSLTGQENSETSVVAAIRPAILASNVVEAHKFRRLFHGFTVAAFENDGRAFVLDFFPERSTFDSDGTLKTQTPEAFRRYIRIREWGPASLLGATKLFGEHGEVPDDNEFVQDVSAGLGLTVAQSREIVGIMMTGDFELFSAFEDWCSLNNNAFQLNGSYFNFVNRAIVRNPDVLRLLPSGYHSVEKAERELSINRSEAYQTAASVVETAKVNA
jgi:hypothetical protein